MKISNSVQRFLLRGTTGVVLCSSVLLSGLTAIAQSNLQLNLPNLRAPGNRESGSTRSTTCIDPDDRLVALMPQSNYGLTQDGYPTLYFYLPPTEAQRVKFVVYEIDGSLQPFYEGAFSVEGEAGIVSVSLPDNGLQKAMEVDETYIWYLSIMCDADDPSGDVVVEGQISRVAAPAEATDASPTALPSIYSAAGLWIDALAASAELKRDQNDAVAWNTLLTAVELDDLITEPLLADGLVEEGTPLSVVNSAE